MCCADYSAYFICFEICSFFFLMCCVEGFDALFSWCLVWFAQLWPVRVAIKRSIGQLWGKWWGRSPPQPSPAGLGIWFGGHLASLVPYTGHGATFRPTVRHTVERHTFLHVDFRVTLLVCWPGSLRWKWCALNAGWSFLMGRTSGRHHSELLFKKKAFLWTSQDEWMQLRVDLRSVQAEAILHKRRQRVVIRVSCTLTCPQIRKARQGASARQCIKGPELKR